MVSGNLPPGVNPAWAAQNNLPKILAITSVIHILALISVGLRLYVRIGLLRTPGKDDAFITAAAVSTQCQQRHPEY